MNLPKVVILDANILYSAPLRDLFIRLALAGLMTARWTDRIHDEWMRNVLNNRPDLSPKRLQRTRTLMNRAIRDCLVSDYESLIPSLQLPDQDDCHVLAAAIAVNADAIITFNLADFPAATLAPNSLAAIHPDEFILQLLDSDPQSVFQVLKLQRKSLRNPSKSAEEFLAIMEKQELPRSVARMRDQIHLV